MPYRERIRVPLTWWVLAVLFALSLLVAFGFYLGPVWGIGVALAGLAVAAAGFASAALTIEVDATQVRIGRAVIDRRYLGEVRALDAAGSRARAEVEADARAHLVLRPWIATAVELTLLDPADPVPYWLVCSRRPVALARALQAVPGDLVPDLPVRDLPAPDRPAPDDAAPDALAPDASVPGAPAARTAD